MKLNLAVQWFHQVNYYATICPDRIELSMEIIKIVDEWKRKRRMQKKKIYTYGVRGRERTKTKKVLATNSDSITNATNASNAVTLFYASNCILFKA